MTGTNAIPVNGYPPLDPLRFEIKNLPANKPAEIHSCFNQFIIGEKLFNDYAIDTGINKKDTELYNLFNSNSLEELKNAFTIG